MIKKINILAFVLFILCSCNNNPPSSNNNPPSSIEVPTPKNVRMLVGSRGNSSYTLFELKDENVLEVTGFIRGRPERGDEPLDNTILNDFVEKYEYPRFNSINSHLGITSGSSIVLTDEQQDSILDLAKNVVVNDADKEVHLIFTDGIRIWVIIDDKGYFSRYYYSFDATEDDWYRRLHSKDVLKLAEILNDLSPIRTELHRTLQQWTPPENP